VLWDPKMTDRAAIETQRSGNSLDSTKADWLDPGLANLNTRSDIYDWWYQLVSAVGTQDVMFAPWPSTG